MHRHITRLSIFLVTLLILPLSLAGAQGPTDDPGSIGDAYYPSLGNSGYDVLHYTIDLHADVDRDLISGTTTIEAHALDDLNTFHLDFAGLTVETVAVNDAAVDWDRVEHELIVIPLVPLPADEPFTVAVTYSGKPAGVQMSGIPFLTGWTNYGGGVFVASEPAGSAGWYPVNDHPLDKATYTFRITVPQPYVVAANGVLTETLDDGDQTTYVWEMRQPLASYLATVNIDEFVRVEETGPHGLPIRNYFPPDLVDQATLEFAKTADMIAYFEDVFGPYPFEAYGVVVADTGFPFALETQTISLFSRSWISGAGAAESAVAHELAHQWFGNSVSLSDWQDIWLNEGFAVYAEWLWFGHQDGPERLDELVRSTYTQIANDHLVYMTALTKDDLRQALNVLPLDTYTLAPDEVAAVVRLLLSHAASADEIDTYIAQFPQVDITGDELLMLIDVLPADEFPLLGDDIRALKAVLGLTEPIREGYLIQESSFSAPGIPAADDLFNHGVYQRGGLVLAALRARVGDEAFFTIIAAYYEAFRDSNATTNDFIALAEEISGEDLGAFFDAWLYTAPLPDIPEMDLSTGM
ncbi:MAG: M1 family metallopeptidase [Anaerolineae bacterium]|nr:M1 family metallopeptidase [Anaerolineae bacterium]